MSTDNIATPETDQDVTKVETKPKDAKAYKCLVPLKHDGLRVALGSKIKLNRSAAADLLAQGYVEEA